MTNKIEEMASKAVGAVKAAKATLEGLDGVFRHLEREHGEATALLMRLKLSSDPKTRRELWSDARRELLAHERAEMLVVYPALRTVADTLPMAEEHDRDAHDLEEAIDALTRLDAASDEWQPALEQLIEMVQEHVQDEEEEYFPIADRAFKEKSKALLERFEEAKAEALRQLSASA
jgi:hypothetical protein